MSAGHWLTLSNLNCTLAIDSPGAGVAVAETVTLLPDTVAPAAGAVIATVVTALLTVILTGADGIALFAESVATAVRVCVPLVSFVLSSTMPYGLLVTAAP